MKWFYSQKKKENPNVIGIPGLWGEGNVFSVRVMGAHWTLLEEGIEFFKAEDFSYIFRKWATLCISPDALDSPFWQFIMQIVLAWRFNWKYG